MSNMTRSDKILIILIMILSLGMIIPLLHQAPASMQAVVQVKDKEVLRIDLTKDAEYEVEGSLGPVHIEVKDQAVRVSQENSRHHYCSMQGFVSDANQPIVCLPNETVITIESDQKNEDVVIR